MPTQPHPTSASATACRYVESDIPDEMTLAEWPRSTSPLASSDARGTPDGNSRRRLGPLTLAKDARMSSPKSIAARMGRWSATHRKTAILGWLAFVVLAVFAGHAVGVNHLKDTDRNVGQSRTADHILDHAGLTASKSFTEYVLVTSKAASVTDASFRSVVAETINVLHGQPAVARVRSPYGAQHAGQIAKDGRAAYVAFDLTGDQKAAYNQVPAVEKAISSLGHRHPGFSVAETGSASVGNALDKVFAKQLKQAGLLSLPLTMLILLVVFGAAVAAGLPLLLAMTAVGATMGLIALPSHIVPMDKSVSEVILLIGLAVGIDYSLFYIKREREERAAGRSTNAALEAAAATSGRAVMISGLTVLAAMAGMLFSGDKTFMSFGIGTAMVVAMAMLGSLTVLPAMLSKLGDRIERGRVPGLGRLRSADGEPRLWRAILRPVLADPVIAALGSTAVLVALAIPALGHAHDDHRPGLDAPVGGRGARARRHAVALPRRPAAGAGRRQGAGRRDADHNRSAQASRPGR